MEACAWEEYTSFNSGAKCISRILNSVLGEVLGIAFVYMRTYILPILLLLASLKLWRFYSGSKDPSSNLPLPPGKMGLPLVGETIEFLRKGSEFFRERTEKYGSIYKTHIFGQKTIRVSGAESVSKILRGEGTLVSSQWPPSVKLILGEGALAHSKGHQHTWRREMIMKAFSPQAVSGYIPPITTIIRDSIKEWCKAGHVHGYPAVRAMTFTVASRLMLGFDAEDRQKHQMLILFEDMLATLFSMPVPVPGIGFYRGMQARKRIVQEIGKCIEERQKIDVIARKDDALSQILSACDDEDGSKLNTREIQDSALEMLFAGHLPTSSASCSILSYIASNPQVYDKIGMELFEHGLLDNKDDKPLDYEVLRSLTYVDAVVKEVLRVAPPVGAGYRKALQTFEIDGHQIPKGWTVIYSIRETQHTSSSFSEGTKFNPDRWLDDGHKRAFPCFNDEDKKSDGFDFVPFGFGTRSCIAQNFVEIFLKIFVVELVSSCSWKLKNGAPQLRYMPVPHPTDNLPLNFKAAPAEMRRRAFTMPSKS